MTTASTTRSRTCPYCGRVLHARTYSLFGRQVFGGWEDCPCQGAQRAREATAARRATDRRREEEAQLDRRCIRSGIRQRYLHAQDARAGGMADRLLSGTGLYLWGGVGTGKTTCASAVAREVIRRGSSVRYERMWDVLESARRGYRDGSDPLAELEAVPFLFLDDLGKERPTAWVLERVFALADERNARMLPTVVTTQYRPGDLVTRLADSGDFDTAQAIVSRLRQGAEVVEFTGTDRRMS